MIKNNKAVKLICSMLMGALFILLVLIILIVTGVIEPEQRYIVFKTNSAEEIYDGTPLKEHTWNITSGSLKKGHRVSVTYKGEQKNVGESENVIEVKIFDEAEADVTSDYSIRYEFGILRVDPRELTVSSASSEKLYDGVPLTNNHYDVSSTEGGLVEGHDIKVAITGSITDVGIVSNTVQIVKVYDNYGNDVTRNYLLTIREGILRVFSEETNEPDDEEPSEGEPEDEGWDDPLFSGDSNLLASEEDRDRLLYTVFSEKDDTLYLKLLSYGNYNGKGWAKATAYNMLTEDGYSAAYLTGLALDNIGADKNSIMLSAVGQPLALPYYALNSGNWSNDVCFDTMMDYNCEYTYTKYSGAVIGTKHPYAEYEAKYREFVYSKYLSVDAATKSYMLSIIQRQGFDKNDIEIVDKVAGYIKSSASYNVDYDRALDESENVALTFLDRYKQGVCKHYATAATLLFRSLGIPARYTVGVMANVSGGRWTDITAARAHAWVEVYLDGTGWIRVEVTGGTHDRSDEDTEKMTLVLAPEPVSKIYDGEPLEVSDKLIGFEELSKLGYYYFAENEGTRTEPGISQSSIKRIVIFDTLGNDITGKFDIRTVTGTVQVYIDALTFESGSYIKEYDGVAEARCQLKAGELPRGYSYKIIPTLDSSVGKRVCEFDVAIVDEYGNDMTELFYIVKKFGMAEITPLRITVKAGDAEKQYDGKPLTNDEIMIVFGELAKGHRIGRYTIEGSQTDPGRSENQITSIMILDENGKDVTKNYVIDLLVGKLTVKD